MDRRKFLQTVATAVALGGLNQIPAFAYDKSWKQSFNLALKKNPWLLGYRGTSRTSYPVNTLAVQGKLPEDLKGVFYRNGPAQHEIGDLRYHHWFDGAGMVHAFLFNGHTVTHQGRFVETQKYISEREAGRAIERGFGTVTPSMRPPTSPDAQNTANINIIEHNGELLALWEGGSAYRLDQETLDTLGLKTWSQETKGLPFGAHPRFDTNGVLWNIGYSTIANAIIIYKISARGVLEKTSVIRLKNVPMIHDFCITRNYLVLLLPPLHHNKDKKGSMLSQFEWRPELGGRALIIDKNNPSKFKTIEIPDFWLFHFSNAYEDGDQLIRFHAPIYADPTIMTQGFKEVMRGKQADFKPGRFVQGSLNLVKGSIELQEFEEAKKTEFPIFDKKTTTERNRYTFLLQNRGRSSYLGNNTVLRLDQETGKTEAYQYSNHEIADEHIFVPALRSREEGAGWLIGTVLNFAKEVTNVNIFNAKKIKNGPVASLSTGYPIPHGLHGSFVRSE